MLLGVIWDEEHEFSISFLLGTRVFRDFSKNRFFQLKRMQQVESLKKCLYKLESNRRKVKRGPTGCKIVQGTRPTPRIFPTMRIKGATFI